MKCRDIANALLPPNLQDFQNLADFPRQKKEPEHHRSAAGSASVASILLGYS